MHSRVNAVETLYSAFPAFMYIDPSLGAPLLEPLFRLQALSNYPIPYATADLGTFHTYPMSEMSRLPTIPKDRAIRMSRILIPVTIKESNNLGIC